MATKLSWMSAITTSSVFLAAASTVCAITSWNAIHSVRATLTVWVKRFRGRGWTIQGTIFTHRCIRAAAARTSALRLSCARGTSSRVTTVITAPSASQSSATRSRTSASKQREVSLHRLITTKWLLEARLALNHNPRPMATIITRRQVRRVRSNRTSSIRQSGCR